MYSNKKYLTSDTPWFKDNIFYQFQEKHFATSSNAIPYFDLKLSENTVTIKTQRGSLINFSGYDYLSLINNQEIKKSAYQAIEQYGTCAGASRLVSGESLIHRTLEENIAEFLGSESALAFVSGHAVNVTVIGFLFNNNDLIIHDIYAHNSILEGIRLSGATRRSFAHNNLNDLEEKLKEAHSYNNVLVIIEGVYSMDGDIADLAGIIKLRDKYKFILMIDEAHSLGTIGKSGRGITEHCNIDASQIDILMGTLSKSLVSCGGYIAGSKELIDYLKFNCPGFVFSTGLPPANAAVANKALNIIRQHSELVEELQNKSHCFRNFLLNEGLPIGQSDGTPVFPIHLPQDIAIKITNDLQKEKINIFPIIYPAVARDASRIRFFLNRKHSKQQMGKVTNLLAKYYNIYLG